MARLDAARRGNAAQIRGMDQLGVLDLTSGKRMEFSPLLQSSPEITSPLDLSKSKKSCGPNVTPISKIDDSGEFLCREMRPSVITPNQKLLPRKLNYRTRWNHRNHPSIDSDSSFESEQENDCIHSAIWSCPKRSDAIDARLSGSTDTRRESICSHVLPDSAQTDTETDSEVYDSSSTLSLGFYKELPELTANVSIDQVKRDTMILELSSFQAEIINPEDIHSELRSKTTKEHCGKNAEEDEEIDDHCLQISQPDEFFEQFLEMETEHSDDSGTMTSTISAGIQETASKYIREIRKTKADMFTAGLNLKVDGQKKQYCMKCNDEFYSIAALLKHLMTHSSRNPGEKLIKCPVCSKRFSTVTTLENHMLRLHTGEMKHVCQICETPFKFSTHLRKHMATSRCGKGSKKGN